MAFNNAPGSGRNDGYDSAATAWSVNSGGGTGGSHQNPLLDPQEHRWSEFGHRVYSDMASNAYLRERTFELAGAAGTPEHIRELDVAGVHPFSSAQRAQPAASAQRAQPAASDGSLSDASTRHPMASTRHVPRVVPPPTHHSTVASAQGSAPRQWRPVTDVSDRTRDKPPSISQCMTAASSGNPQISVDGDSVQRSCDFLSELISLQLESMYARARESVCAHDRPAAFTKR